MNFFERYIVIPVLALIVGVFVAVMVFAPRKHTAMRKDLTKQAAIIRLVRPDTRDALCSGTVITPKLAVTAAHCVVMNLGFMVVLNPIVGVQTLDGADMGNVAVLAANPNTDLALLSGDFSGFNTMPMVFSTKSIMDAVNDLSVKWLVCGFPYGGAFVCSEVKNPRFKLFKIAGDGFLYPGMSGGPLLNMSAGGVIMGVNTAVSETDQVILSPTVEIYRDLHVFPPAQ